MTFTLLFPSHHRWYIATQGNIRSVVKKKKLKCFMSDRRHTKNYKMHGTQQRTKTTAIDDSSDLIKI